MSYWLTTQWARPDTPDFKWKYVTIHEEDRWVHSCPSRQSGEVTTGYFEPNTKCEDCGKCAPGYQGG